MESRRSSREKAICWPYIERIGDMRRKFNLRTQRHATARKGKSVQEVSKRKARLPRTHQDYWAGRLFHNTYTWRGRRQELPEFYVKIRHAGRRFTFNLRTGNRDVASSKARDIFVTLVAKGWDATLTQFAPHKVTASELNTAPSIGDFLKEVERTSGLQPKTFARYAQYFRMIVAHIKRIKSETSRYDRRHGRPAWTGRIDAVPLTEVTPATAADWKRAYLSRAGDGPERLVQVRRAFNTALRSAKSLFSAKVIHADGFRVKVPRFKVADPQFGEREVMWFETLPFEKPGSMKFHAPSGITYQSLLLAARRELLDKYPDAYLLLLLCLCAGLRRGEADVLLWSQVDPQNNLIRVDVNEFIQPKHDSCGEVAIDAALCKELLSLKRRAEGPFVVNSPRAWVRKKYTWYRCEPHWRTLMEWLAKKGIDAQKKNHELRKIFGDAVTRESGIYAASSQLRHSTVQMTERHYTDPRKRAALPVADIFRRIAVLPKQRAG
jgi:hypothetical protein